MKWSFYAKRNKRYQIALERYRKEFVMQSGFDLLFQVGLLPKEHLSLEEDRAIYIFQEIAKVLNHPSKKYPKAYRTFCRLLRKLFSILSQLPLKQAWHQELYQITLDLCLTKYHHTHFYSFGQVLLEEMFSTLTLSGKAFDYEEHFKNYTFEEEACLIESSKPLVHIERDLRKFDEFVLKRHFDSHQYNLPFLLYTFAFYRQGQIKKVKMVRMGCPTKESWFKNPQVVDEFKGFLTHLKHHEKKHLYINKQKTWGEEGRRSKALIELQEEFGHFFCVCLPSDGDFYHQKGRFIKIPHMSEFKSLFVKMLLGKVNVDYYHVPQKWREDPFFVEQLSTILDEVHELYFQNEENLIAEQRHLFIDLAYTHLILFFLDYESFDSINITCRDGIDRAGCEQTKLLYYFHISLGIENELESKKERQYVQHIPVYLAKGRPIVDERRQVLSKVFDVFDEKVREKIFQKHQSQPLLYEKPLFIKKD